MSKSLDRPFIILGARGHATVVIDLLQALGCTVAGIADPELPPDAKGPLGVTVLGDDSVILKMDPDKVFLAMGIGSIGTTGVRTRVYEKFIASNFAFPALLHPRAVVSPHASIADGTQVMAGCVIQAGSHIGNNCIINTRASVDHDCEIGDGVHIAPGAVLSGGVVVENGTHIGTGACIIQSIKIGSESLIGAGVTVLKDVPSCTIIRASKTPVWNDT